MWLSGPSPLVPTIVSLLHISLISSSFHLIGVCLFVFLSLCPLLSLSLSLSEVFQRDALTRAGRGPGLRMSDSEQVPASPLHLSLRLSLPLCFYVSLPQCLTLSALTRPEFPPSRHTVPAGNSAKWSSWASGRGSAVIRNKEGGVGLKITRLYKLRQEPTLCLKVSLSAPTLLCLGQELAYTFSTTHTQNITAFLPCRGKWRSQSRCFQEV